MKKLLLLLITHTGAIAIGFAAGIFALPILIAPPPPAIETLAENEQVSEFAGTFDRDRAGSDFLHWGEGGVFISKVAVTFEGRLAPGPDYQLYLSPEFVETEDEFIAVKSSMVRLGPVNTFEGFMVTMPAGVNPADYSAVIVWCETFGEFITSARYEAL